MTIKNIIKTEYLSISQVKKIPSIISNWLTFDECYSLDKFIEAQTKAFAMCHGFNSSSLIKIEQLEWACNSQGRKNVYDSDLTIWVTAIVELSPDEINRLSFDLFDSVMIDNNLKCSGSIY